MKRIAHIAVFLASLSLSGCGAERDLSGIWRQAECSADGWAYELHLGRYGDGLTGLVVRYRCKASVETFAPENECGCFLISTGKAADDVLSFALYRPTEPFGPTADFEAEDPQCRPPPPDCARTFILDGGITTERLEGTSGCTQDTVSRLSFESVKGKLRTNCVAYEGPS